MTADKHAVDAAIYRWLEALARVPLGSVSAQLERYARLGCRVQSSTANRGGAYVGLRAAEGPLRRCSPQERRLLYERYWTGATVRMIPYVSNGVRREYPKRVLRSWSDVSCATGESVSAAKKRLSDARKKIAAALEEDSHSAR